VSIHPFPRITSFTLSGPGAGGVHRAHKMSSLSGNTDTVDSSYCGDRLLGVSIAIAAVQLIVVPVRFYTRYIQRIKCTLDDYLILPALVGHCPSGTAVGRANKKWGCADRKPWAIRAVYCLYVPCHLWVLLRLNTIGIERSRLTMHIFDV
jgi:hypothetical protein